MSGKPVYILETKFHKIPYKPIYVHDYHLFKEEKCFWVKFVMPTTELWHALFPSIECCSIKCCIPAPSKCPHCNQQLPEHLQEVSKENYKGLSIVKISYADDVLCVKFKYGFLEQDILYEK